MFLIVSLASASPLAICHDGQLEVLGRWTDEGFEAAEQGEVLGHCVHEGALHAPPDVVELDGEPMMEIDWQKSSTRYGRWLETWQEDFVTGTLALQGPYAVEIPYELQGQGCLDRQCVEVHPSTHWLRRDDSTLVLVHTSGGSTRSWTAYALGETAFTATEVVLETDIFCTTEGF